MEKSIEEKLKGLEVGENTSGEVKVMEQQPPANTPPKPFKLNMESVMQTNSIEAMVLSPDELDKLSKEASEYAVGFQEMSLIEQAKKQGYNVENMEDLSKLKFATKDEFDDMVEKGVLKLNIVKREDESGNAVSVLQEAPPESEIEETSEDIGDIDEESENSFEAETDYPNTQHTPISSQNQQVATKKVITKTEIKRSTLIGAGNNKFERIKNRRRQGRFTTGMLYNSNMLVQCYDLDKPLLLEEILNGFMYLTATMFHSKKLMKKLYEHTSVICADGSTVNTAEKFFSIMALDDFEEYLIYLLIASNDNGLLKGIDMSCTKEGCNHKFVSDIDLCAGLEGMITSERQAIYDSYDKNEKLATLIDKAQIKDINMVTSYDETLDEYMIITVSSPTVEKYFSIKEALMEYIHESLMEDDDVRYKVQSSVKDFFKRGMDERLRILATLEREKYAEISDTINIMAYIDNIHVIPGALYKSYENNTHPKYKVMGDFKDGEDNVIIVKPTPDDIRNLYEVFSQLDLTGLETMRKCIGDISSRLKRGTFTISKICPKCGHKIEQDFSAISLFLVFLNLKEAGLSEKK